MALRDYQETLIADINAAWDSGQQYVMSVAPTGSGKTVVLSSILKDKDRPAVAIAHRQELVSQLALALNREQVPHAIIAPKQVVSEIVRLQIDEHGRSYYMPRAAIRVAGVNTLANRAGSDPWFDQVEYLIHDEGHHVLRDNIFGKAVALFPKARGLFTTAHALRSDGRGLGRDADGFVDHLVVAPSARALIDRGFLADYRLVAPLSDVDVSEVAIGSTGDFNPVQLRAAMHKSSRIVGDVVREYIRFAPGKLGLTFAVDIESAQEIEKAFLAADVPAAIITGETTISDRARIMRRFRNRELLQLVSVDVLGEGTDIPAVEVVSMARPTQSLQLYCLDPETEVLTPDGWKKHSDSIDTLVTFNPKDSSCSITSVTGRIQRPLYPHEKMVGIKSPHLDVLVSDQHRMLSKGHSSSCKNWVFRTAESLSGMSSLSRIPVSGFGSFKGANLSNCDLSFLGWFLSDGSLSKHTNAVCISQSSAKKSHLEHIRSTLKDCGFKFGEYLYRRKNVPVTHHDQIVFSVSYGKPRGTDKHLTGWGRLESWVDKTIPAIYDSLTREQLMVLLESLNLGDGNNNHGSLSWTKRSLTIACGGNERMADRLQALCVQRGLRCNKSTVQYESRGIWHYLYIKDVQSSTIAGAGCKDGKIGNKKSYKRSRFEVKKDSPSFVWCLSSDAGTLITRRNGKVAIMGNCQQFGRALRVSVRKDLADVWERFTDEERIYHIRHSEKPSAIILDHVGNWSRHGLPDVPRQYSLARREKRSRIVGIPLKRCDMCLQPYEAIYPSCPHCGTIPVPKSRGTPEQVEGDLAELDPAKLAQLRAEVSRIDDVPRIPQHLGLPAAAALKRRHWERQEAQRDLRAAIALWAGYWKTRQTSDSESYRRFYLMFGRDIMTAQTLGANDAKTLELAIRAEIENLHLDYAKTGGTSTTGSAAQASG